MQEILGKDIRVKHLKPGMEYSLFPWESSHIIKSIWQNEFGCHINNEDGTGRRYIDPESFAIIYEEDEEDD